MCMLARAAARVLLDTSRLHCWFYQAWPKGRRSDYQASRVEPDGMDGPLTVHKSDFGHLAGQAPKHLYFLYEHNL